MWKILTHLHIDPSVQYCTFGLRLISWKRCGIEGNLRKNCLKITRDLILKIREFCVEGIRRSLPAQSVYSLAWVKVFSHFRGFQAKCGITARPWGPLLGSTCMDLPPNDDNCTAEILRPGQRQRQDPGRFQVRDRRYGHPGGGVHAVSTSSSVAPLSEPTPSGCRGGRATWIFGRACSPVLGRTGWRVSEDHGGPGERSGGVGCLLGCQAKRQREAGHPTAWTAGCSCKKVILLGVLFSCSDY